MTYEDLGRKRRCGCGSDEFTDDRDERPDLCTACWAKWVNEDVQRVIRRVRQYTLLPPGDCDPPHGLDLSPGGRDEEKVQRLAWAFALCGFDPEQPALVGYPLGGRVQLLTGTHRREAALRAGIQLPVRMVLRSSVEGAWGTDRWRDLVADVPVRDLERADVPDSGWTPSLEERISAKDLKGEGEER